MYSITDTSCIVRTIKIDSCVVSTCYMYGTYNVYSMSCTVCMVGYSMYSIVRSVSYYLKSIGCAVKWIVCKERFVYYNTYNIVREVQQSLQNICSIV